MITHTEADYESLSQSQIPEMQRCDLSPVILQMKALGIVNLVRFDYISVSLLNRWFSKDLIPEIWRVCLLCVATIINMRQGIPYTV